MMLRVGVFGAVLAVSLSSAVAQAPSAVSVGDVRFDFADPARAPTTDQQKRFLAKYRAARANGDTAAISALVHPASAACNMSPIARDYFAARLGKEVETTPLENVRVIFVPVPEGHRDPFHGDANTPPLMTLPVKPTQFIAIDHNRGEYDAKGVLVRSFGGTIIRELAPDGDDLKLVVHCLTQEGEPAFAKKAAGHSGASPQSKFNNETK